MLQIASKFSCVLFILEVFVLDAIYANQTAPIIGRRTSKQLDEWDAENLLVPLVNVNQGLLQGVREKDYLGGTFYSFMGIPFAEAPLQDRRFTAPIPKGPWDGIFVADTMPQPCFQLETFFVKNTFGVEDCLYLNVYAKQLHLGCIDDCPPKVLRPVMVFIHGGGFNSGSSTRDLYGPEHLMTEDIVLVTIQYRLGLLGFLSLDFSDYDVESVDLPKENNGLRDMILALQWVQQNIINFLGDPTDVTIFGESAGAAAVHYLVLSHRTKGLFRKAIMQSGSALNSWGSGKRIELETMQTSGLFHGNAQETMRYLREVSLADLIDIQIGLGDNLDPYYSRYIAPVVEANATADDAVLLRSPVDIILSGDYNHVPMIFGYNSREGLLASMFLTNPASLLGRQIEGFIPHVIFDVEMGTDDSRALAEQIAQFYLGTTELDAAQFETDGYIQMVGDSTFVEAIRTAIRLHLVTAQKPIYAYEMTVESPLNLVRIFNNITMPGVCHADDIGYLFKTMIRVKTIEEGSLEDTLIQRFVQLWTNFARTGNPTHEMCLEMQDSILAVDWPPCTTASFNMLNIGSELEVRLDYDNDGIKFWRELPNRLMV